MALVTRKSNPGWDANSALYAPQLANNFAGEDLDAGAPCYVAADGLTYMSDATAANIKAHVDGWTVAAKKVGEPVTLHGLGLVLEYGSGLTPGTTLYLAATKGRLDTAPTTGDAVGIARVLRDGRHIRALRLV